MTTLAKGYQTQSYAQWQTATWQDYERLRDDPSIERVQLFYDNHQLLIENMGWEGILHSEVRELLDLILGLWLMKHPEIKSKILGSCLMEKVGQQAALTSGFTAELLSRVIERMKLGSNISAASWFNQQLSQSFSTEES